VSDTCPYCGDGLESIGTMNHIECVRAVMDEADRLRWMFAHCHVMYWTFEDHGECDGCKKVLAQLNAQYDVVRQTL
jgi:uncharacterized protein with PIN domain